MFGFFSTNFIAAIGFIALNAKAIPLKCVSMNNQECKVRPVYPYSVLVNKYSGSCNDINNPHAKFMRP